jgi:cellulose biosynthesis protein BcsQ
MVQFCDENPEYETVSICKNVMMVTSHKGGTQKTTTSFQLAQYCCDELHEKVLLIDFDKQGSQGLRFNKNGDDPKYKNSRVSKVFREIGNENLINTIKPAIAYENKVDNEAYIHILLGDADIPDAVDSAESRQFGDKTGSEGKELVLQMFYKFIDIIKQDYQRVIIDNSPAMDKGSWYGMNVCDTAIVTVNELESIEQFETTCRTIIKYGKKSPKIIPVFVNYTKDLGNYADEFDDECKRQGIKPCCKPAYFKYTTPSPGQNERRFTPYRIIRAVLPENACVNGISHSKDVIVHKYKNCRSANKRMIKSVCGELINKASSGYKAENLCNDRIFKRVMNSLKKYLSVLHEMDIKALGTNDNEAELKQNLKQVQKFDVCPTKKRFMLERKARFDR